MRTNSLTISQFYGSVQMMIHSAQPPLSRPPTTIGGKLRAAREANGWTLDELSVKTRIPVRHLETIEAGRSVELPGGFIGKSFVRQYAQAVGLDAEQALYEFIAQTGINLEVPFEERKVSPYTPESLQRFQSRMWRNLAFVALGLLLVIVVTVYALRRPTSADSGRLQTAPTGLSNTQPAPRIRSTPEASKPPLTPSRQATVNPIASEDSSGATTSPARNPTEIEAPPSLPEPRNQ